MTRYSDILEARARAPSMVHELAVRRVLEAAGERPLTLIPDAGPVFGELDRRGYGGPFSLRVHLEEAGCEDDHEVCQCITGQTLRQAGRLGKRLGRTVIYSGPEITGEVCILPLGGGLERFGPRGTEGICRAYRSARGVAIVRFDVGPWAWMEAVMEDAWRRGRAG